MIDLELAEALVVAGRDSNCAVAERCPDRAAERLRVEGLGPIVVQTPGMRLNLEAAGQSAGSFDIVAGSSAVVVVAAPGVGRGCSALPRPASDSYLRCLLCRVGAARTEPGAR